MFKFEDLILRIPNVVTEKECKLLIDYFNENEDDFLTEHSRNSNTGEVESSTFKCLNLPHYSEVHNIVHSKTREMIIKWCEHLNEFGAFQLPTLSKVLNYAHKYRLLKYEPGSKIHPHTDFSPFIYASSTLNLNDEYTGGDFGFWNCQHTIKLNKGEGIIFPADLFWVHEVTPVETGVRYSTNCFIGAMDTELIDEVHDYAYNESYKRTIDPGHSQYGQYLWRD